MYSQGDEEKYILEFFRGYSKGTFLDIGAFHPTVFSNTRALYEMGFKGVFVEPSDSLRAVFDDQYGNDPEIQIVDCCVGAYTGTVNFFDAGGDAISTTIESETSRWQRDFGSKFVQMTKRMVTPSDLLRESRYKTFDFVSIDTEGNVLEIVQNFDFRFVGAKLVCVEWNSKDFECFQRCFEFDLGFSLLFKNAENLIYASS
jgi:FkbM family methyltransferase